MKKILIVNSNYYKEISKKLIFNVKKKLNKKRYKVYIFEVPGVYKYPLQ